MPTNIQHAQAGWSQAKSRVSKLFWDHHKDAKAGFPGGRPWYAECERQVDGSDAAPIGEMIPVGADMLIGLDGVIRIAPESVSAKGLADGIVVGDGSTLVKGWCAPWVPEPKYMMLALRSLGGNRFRIDYTRMRKDYEDANIGYYSRVNAAANASRWEAIPLYAPVPFQIQSARLDNAPIGAPPKSPKIPEAALAGDRWLIGFSEEPNERLKALLDADNRVLTNVEYFTKELWRSDTKVTQPESEFSADELQHAATVLRQAATMRAAKAAKKTMTEEAA